MIFLKRDKKLTETMNKVCEREKKGHNDGRNRLTVHCVGKKENWIVQMLQE
jgi:hypothetical protein